MQSLHRSTTFTGQWQCDWRVVHPRYPTCQWIFPQLPKGARIWDQGVSLVSSSISPHHLCLPKWSSCYLCPGCDTQAVFSLSWVWQNQLSPTHAVRPQKVEGGKSGAYGYFPYNTVQFINSTIGFFHTMLQPAHRSFRKTSQKLAEKILGESLTMMMPEITG